MMYDPTVAVFKTSLDRTMIHVLRNLPHTTTVMSSRSAPPLAGMCENLPGVAFQNDLNMAACSVRMIAENVAVNDLQEILHRTSTRKPITPS